MTSQFESNSSTVTPTKMLKEVAKWPFLKDIAKSYQLDLQCTMNLEELMIQEKFLQEEVQEGNVERIEERNFKNKIRRVIEELVTVKNCYLSMLTQTLTTVKKQDQKIRAQSVLLQLHNRITSSKDFEIENLKGIIRSLVIRIHGNAIISETETSFKQTEVDCHVKMYKTTIDHPMPNLDDSTTKSRKTTETDSREHLLMSELCLKETDPSSKDKTRSPSVSKKALQTHKTQSNHKRATSLKKNLSSSQQSLNLSGRLTPLKDMQKEERSISSRRSSDSRRFEKQETFFSHERPATTKNKKILQSMTERKLLTQGSPTYLSRNMKTLNKKRSSENLLKTEADCKNQNRDRNNRENLGENAETLKFNKIEVPKGVKVTSEKIDQDHDGDNMRNIKCKIENRSAYTESLYTEQTNYEKFPTVQKSTSLSRSPDSTPNLTPTSSRTQLSEGMAFLTGKDPTDVSALQKSLKRSCRMLTIKKSGQALSRISQQADNTKSNYSIKDGSPMMSLEPLTETNQKLRRSNSIPNVNSNIPLGPQKDIKSTYPNRKQSQKGINNQAKPDIVSRKIATEGMQDQKSNLSKEALSYLLVEKAKETAHHVPNSQSSLDSSLLHEINSISFNNVGDGAQTANLNKNQKIDNQEQGKVFEIRDMNRILNAQRIISARPCSPQVSYSKDSKTDRGDVSEKDILQRRKSQGRRENNEVTNLEKMYGSKKLLKVKNWTPLLPKKN